LTVRSLEVVILAVNSHVVHILASAEVRPIEVLKVLLKLSDVNLFIRPFWIFELTNIKRSLGLHERLLTEHHNLLCVSLLGGLVHIKKTVRLVKDVFLTSIFSFLGPFLLAACFPGVSTAH
jgi:hypothetical protein